MGSWLPLLQLALAADLAVGPTQTYSTIRDAVNAASDGDRVLVDPGDYTEDRIQASGLQVEIESTGPGVNVDCTDAFTLFELSAGSDFTITGLNFDGQDDTRFAVLDASTMVLDRWSCSTPRGRTAPGSAQRTAAI